MKQPTNIQTAGGIFTHHFIDSLIQDSPQHPALRAETFTFPHKDRLTEKQLESHIAQAWEDLVPRWDAVEREFKALDISTLRRRWILPLLKALSFLPEFNKADLVLEKDFRFPISHLGWAGTSSAHIPVHTLRYQDENTLETRAGTGRGIKAMAPHDMLQRYLNLSSDHRWGILCDGVYLRLLRDFHHTYTRGYTEFDLQGIFTSRDFASFRAMFRLLHASRFVLIEGKESAPIDELYEDALAQGVAIGKDLRDNVQQAIETLANGFLVSTPGLLDHLRSQPDGPAQLYQEILITIYRILFLLFAEQRGMLPGRGSLYMEEFSLTAFRTLAESPLGDDPNQDLWEKLKTTFAMLEHGVKDLDVFAYNGALFSQHRTPLLTPHPSETAPQCRNDHLLITIRHLTTVEKDRVLQRISYSDLSVEEIGSIYESLLETTPQISSGALTVDDREIAPNAFFLDPRGTGRKTTGSYYTPPSLVNELIKSALEPVMLSRLNDAVAGYEPELVEALTDQERQSAENALLRIKIVDPAAGSGAFLIAANNRLGLELARVRTGSLFPPEAEIRHARRDVLAHCIHGVDLNPMSVELCKVSLWINAAVEDSPLNFLDHHIQCGNSLIGATPELVKGGIPNKAYNPVTGDDKKLATSLKRQNRQELKGQASLGFKVTLIEDQAALKSWLKASRLAGSQPTAAEKAFMKYQTSHESWLARLPYDLWTAAFFTPIQPGQPIPTTDEVRQALQDPSQITDDLQALARRLAERHRFFHWHLAFPEVFDADGQGGFDVVLGNPPWERVKLQEKEFFEGKDDAITNAANANARKQLIKNLPETNPPLWHSYQRALHKAEAESNFYHNSEVYPLAGRGDINLYQVFAELGRHLIASNGRAGMIVPTGVATDDTCKFFFADLVENNQIASLYDFENKKALFPEVHRSYKFCLLTLKGIKDTYQQPAEFAFFLLAPDDLQDQEKTFNLTTDDFALLNPNTRTCPIFRSRTEADLTRKLYQQAPVLVNEHTGENPWGISFMRMFDMSNDSHLFRTRDELEGEGFELQGNFFVKEEEIYLPLYEAKMFHQYNHRYAQFLDESKFENNIDYSAHNFVLPRYWIDAEERELHASHLAFRNTCRSTDIRTGIFSILPSFFVGNNAPIIETTKNCIEELFMLGCLNSFITDYIIRNKIGGIALNFYILKQIPIIPPTIIPNKLLCHITSIVFHLVYTGWDLQLFADFLWNFASKELQNVLINQNKKCLKTENNPPDYFKVYEIKSDQLHEKCPITPFDWDDNIRFELRCELDALYSHLYNLTHEELAYILNTFPIVKRKDNTEHGKYITKRLILEKFDALADDPILEGACIPLKDRVSVLEKVEGSSAKQTAATLSPVTKTESMPQPKNA